jgi:hypothetical protein
MKTEQNNKSGIRQPSRLWRASLAGLTLAASISVSHAYQVVLNQFNSAAEVTAFGTLQNWNGSTNGSVSFSTQDAQANAASGSMKMQIEYSTTENGGTFASVAAPMPLYAPLVTAVEFDIMVDPASPVDPNGNAFYFQIGFNSPSFQKLTEFWLGPYGKPFTPGVWMHVSNNIEGSLPAAFVSQLFINPYDANYTSVKTPIVYIDNIVLDQPTFPNFNAFTFDNANFLGGVYTNWYGNTPASVTFDPTKDFYGNTNSGSAYISSPLEPDQNDSIFVMGFDTNWATTPFPNPETNTINGGQYTGMQIDVLWDTVNSTVGITNFNASGDINGIPIGVCEGPTTGNNGFEAFGAKAPNVPNTASNGWVRMFLPLNQTTVGISDIVGLWFKKYGNPAISGTADYWIDNVTFLGGPTTVPQPTMSLVKPVAGLNLVSTGRSGNNPYDREDLETFNGTYSFEGQGANAVTYEIGIASLPPTNYPAYRAWIILDPTAPVNAYPDYADANVILLLISRDADGQHMDVTLQAKTNAPNGNGSLATANSIWTNSSRAEGNWSFTFTQDTNILVKAPDGESANLAFPLGFAPADVATYFGGGSMYALFGGFNNGAGIGQRVVLSNASITGPGVSTPFTDNFLTDTNINVVELGGPWIDISSSSYANNPYEAVFLTIPTWEYYANWSVPATGFNLYTNSNIGNKAGWAEFNTNAIVQPPTGVPVISQLGDHFQAILDQSNLPPSGPLFFRVSNQP